VHRRAVHSLLQLAAAMPYCHWIVIGDTRHEPKRLGWDGGPVRAYGHVSLHDGPVVRGRCQQQLQFYGHLHTYSSDLSRWLNLISEQDREGGRGIRIACGGRRVRLLFPELLLDQSLLMLNLRRLGVSGMA
jgi:hypothetical protein